MKRKSANQEIGDPRVLQKIGAPGGTWHSRGYLPHFESSEIVQHVTFHLADSLPQTALSQLRAELKTLPLEERNIELRKRVDAWVEAGHGSCILRNASNAEMAQGSLLKFDSERYRLFAWAVMPNHVHVLLQPIEPWTVAKIVAGWKKFTARSICDAANRENSGRQDVTRKHANREIGAPGGDRTPLWHPEYWDRYIRDEAHLMNVIEYIHLNPVKAGLVARAESWRWSSAYAEDAPGGPIS